MTSAPLDPQNHRGAWTDGWESSGVQPV